MSPPLEKCFPSPRSTMIRTPGVAVQRLEHRAELVALAHGHDVEGRAVEHDVRALARMVDLDPKAVEVGRELRGRRLRSSAQGKFLPACPLLDASVGEILPGIRPIKSILARYVSCG